MSTSYCHECILLLSMVCADQQRLYDQIALILLRILQGFHHIFLQLAVRKNVKYIFIFSSLIFFLDEINLQLRFHVFVCFVTSAFQYPFYYHLLSLFIIEISVIFYIYFSDIEDEIVSLKEFSTELIVSSAVQCIKTILKQDVDLPNTLPGGMSARFRMGTGLANYIQVIRFCLEL